MKKRTQFCYTLLILCFMLSQKAFTQDTIKIMDGSFEDLIPSMGKRKVEYSNYNNYKTHSWKNCGLDFRGESPFDVHGAKAKYWDVKMNAIDGENFVGLVVRDNESYEAISQKLTSPLIKDNYYSFSLALARSPIYNSHSRVNFVYHNKTQQNVPEPTSFTEPCVLKIWGGEEECDRRELLFTSGPITDEEWKKQTIYLAPERNHDFIVFEVYYVEPVLIPYCGNILIDNISDIIRVSHNDYIASEPEKMMEKTKHLKIKRKTIYLSESSQVYEVLSKGKEMSNECIACQAIIKAHALIILEEKSKKYGLYRAIVSFDNHYLNALEKVMLSKIIDTGLKAEVLEIIHFVKEREENGNPPDFIKKIEKFSNSKVISLLDKALIISYIESDLDQLILELNAELMK